MKTFALDLCVASLPMRLIAIGFVEIPKYKGNHEFRHKHSLFELQYVMNGHCTKKIGEETYTQKQGEIYLISPGIYHSQKSSTVPFEMMGIMVEIPAPSLSSAKAAKETFLSLSTMQYFKCDAGDMTDTLEGIKKLFYDYDKKICGIDELRVLTELLLLKIIQRVKATDKKTPRFSPTQAQRTFIIDEFFNFNFNRNDGDKLLANQLGVSVRQLNRILKNLYGCNFREKLIEMRLEIALDLLVADKSIAEISQIIGYSCPANFSTFIKNTTGKTPSEIRRQNAGRGESVKADSSSF